MMQINNEWFYEDLTPENTIALLEKFKNGEEPKVGPQNNRHSCEGPLGKTTLNNREEIEVTHERDFLEIKK